MPVTVAVEVNVSDDDENEVVEEIVVQPESPVTGAANESVAASLIIHLTTPTESVAEAVMPVIEVPVVSGIVKVPTDGAVPSTGVTVTAAVPTVELNPVTGAAAGCSVSQSSTVAPAVAVVPVNVTGLVTPVAP